MLRRCPGDNLGQRFWLGSLLLRVDRFSDALFFAQQWISNYLSGSGSQAYGGTKFKKPHSSILSASEEEKLGKYFKDALMYTAAFASFKLFGDCPQSRQYLRLAATINPIILVKILAKIATPSMLLTLISSYRESFIFL